MQILLVNFFFYISYFFYIYKKYHYITIYHLAWLWFTLIAFMGYYSYLIGAYTEVFKDNGKFLLEPYVYSFISIFLLLLPLKKFQKNYTVESYKALDKYRLNILANILLVLSLLRVIVNLVAFSAIISSTGLGDAYANYHENGNAALGLSDWQTKILWLTQPVHSNFFWFVPLIALTAYNNKDIISRKWILITFMFFTSEILGYLSRSARGELMYLVIKIGLLLVLIWPYFRSAIKKKVISLGIIFVAFLFVYAIYITIDRFQDSSLNTQDGIIRYLGEAFPNLGNQLWNNVRQHPMGLRFFPFLFGIDENSISVADYQNYWANFVGVPMLNFKTIYGDFYIEFGILGGFIGIGVLSLIWMIVLKNKNLKLYMMPLLAVYFHTITMAPLYFTYRGTGKYIQILWAIVFVIIIKCLLYKKIQKYA